MKIVIALALLAASATSGAFSPAMAAENLRWTSAEDRDASFAHIVAKINEKTGLALTEADFSQGEDRDLAFSHYRRYDQVRDGVRVDGMSVRVWSRRYGPKPRLIQLEAQVEAPNRTARARIPQDLSWAGSLARAAISATEDGAIRSLKAETLWSDGRVVRLFTAKARHGTHVVKIDLATRAVVAATYEDFPRADHFSVPALVYPIYEEYGAEILPREPALLKYLVPAIRRPDADPFAPLRDRTYLESKLDPIQGETAEGQAQGFWTQRWLTARADALRAQVPLSDNRPASGDLLLQGEYATINIHPDAFASFTGVEIPARFSPQLYFTWSKVEGTEDYAVVPGAAYYGKPLADRKAALFRDASRHPENDPVFYMNGGFDEVQVYYAVNQLFDSLRPLGFKDPELSTRPFNAFLYDPDIAMQNNAYYDSDTINFTTYTPTAPNMARDNTTIWHELGHGVMDRLMGTQLDLADTGGLSEGMADFVAELVLRAVNRDRPFLGQQDQRIINRTGFFLTNEVHDDGEAYGGAMKAILDAATQAYGEEKGGAMVTDLVLEAMRLSRDHPHLTAQDWFEHVLFADELGRKGLRAPGELASLIRGALAARNFMTEAERATFQLSYAGVSVDAGTDGSRGHEIRLELAPGEQATYPLEISLHDGTGFRFTYPATVKVFFNSGPLQGAIDWEGEDAEPALYTIDSPDAARSIPLTVLGCDAINRTDGTCSDFAYVQVYKPGDDKPVAKKRFYLRIKPKDATANSVN